MNRFPFKRVSLALSIVALMAGCSSGVKLDDVPVEDRGATSTAPGANSGSTGQSGVAPVDRRAGRRKVPICDGTLGRDAAHGVQSDPLPVPRWKAAASAAPDIDRGIVAATHPSSARCRPQR